MEDAVGVGVCNSLCCDSCSTASTPLSLCEQLKEPFVLFSNKEESPLLFQYILLICTVKILHYLQTHIPYFVVPEVSDNHID